MMVDDLNWHSFDRDELPSALFGFERDLASSAARFRLSDLDAGRVALGFSSNGSDSEYNPPRVIVVDDRQSAEIFSWLKVYAEQTFPLSQFGRVTSAHDWELFQVPRGHQSEQGIRTDRWASVVLGELLSQSDSDTKPGELPLSRSLSCFSSTLARVAITHGNDEATRQCVARLRKIESDPRFAKRALAVSDLFPIWAISKAALSDVESPNDVATLVTQAAQGYAPESQKRWQSKRQISIRDFPGLFSDSIEKRVVAFQELTEAALRNSTNDSIGQPASVVVAAGAFLVGRGTSHSFLVRRLVGAFPSACAWFGLLAALSGARSWDPSWSRAVKGIERELKATFDWASPSSPELSWLEYSWLTNAFDCTDVFLEIPRMFPRAVSLEVMPGANFQLRIATAESISQDTVQRSSPNLVSHVRDLESALGQFVELASRAQQLLDESTNNRQTSLPINESQDVARERNSRNKRTK